MTTKTLSNAEPNGYVVSSTYSGLIIDDGVSIGGSGVVSSAQYLTLFNAGVVVGGMGTYGRLAKGGSGFTAVSLKDGGVAANTGTLTGGAGGASYYSYCGNGGAGAYLSSGAFTNTGVITGGVGGQSAGFAATNGIGGIGIEFGGAGSLNNSATIRGGAGSYERSIGGDGGLGVFLAAGGYASIASTGIIAGGAGGEAYIFGGDGGRGISILKSGSVNNNGAITGGAGGAGGPGDPKAIYGGDGGAGAYLSGGNLTNSGFITGGASPIGVAFGGTGGAGVIMSAAFLANLGTVAGGAGGVSGYALIAAGDGGDDGVVLRGGDVVNGPDGDTAARIVGFIGVSVSGVGTVTNYGIIAGTGGTAVDFTNAADRLIVDGGATFNGAVVGGGGTLDLNGGTGTITGLGAGGAVSGYEAFDFSGFDSFILEADGSWTLTGDAGLGAGQSLTLAQGSTATIADGDDIAVTGGSVVIDGAGTLAGGGTVSLNASGYMSGAVVGDSLDNFDDTIAGGGFIKGPLSLTNGATGVIDANAGRMVLNLAGETVTNDGLIEAAGSNGLLLVRDTTIDGAGGGSIEAAKEIMLDDAAISGGSLTIQAGGRLLTFGGDVAHASTIDLGAGIVINAGTLEGGGGGLIVDGDVAGGGLVIAENGSLKITGDVTGAGKMEVFGKGTLEIDGAQGGTIAFGAGATGELVLGDSAAFTGTITGLSRTGLNAIDLEDIDFVDGPTATYAANQNPATGGVLTVSDGTHTARIALRGNYASATFTVKNDGGGGTVVTDPPATARTHAFITAMASFAAVDGPVADKPWLAPASTSLAPVLAQASR